MLVLLWAHQKPVAHKVSSQSNISYSSGNAHSHSNSKFSCFNAFFCGEGSEWEASFCFTGILVNEHSKDWWLGRTGFPKTMEKEKIRNWKIPILPQNSSNIYKNIPGLKGTKIKKENAYSTLIKKYLLQPDPLHIYPHLIRPYGKCHSYSEVSTVEISNCTVSTPLVKTSTCKGKQHDQGQILEDMWPWKFSSKSYVNSQIRTDNLFLPVCNTKWIDWLVLCWATQPFCNGKAVTCRALMIQLVRFKLSSSFNLLFLTQY